MVGALLTALEVKQIAQRRIVNAQSWFMSARAVAIIFRRASGRIQ
jgi:hypothetical protein